MSTRKAALEEAAAYAEFYAAERMLLCGDSILHDPVLKGTATTLADFVKSQSLQIDGTINSAAYHAAMDIARHLRALAEGETR